MKYLHSYIRPLINPYFTRLGLNDIRTLSPLSRHRIFHPPKCSGIYRVGFTIFTLAVICKIVAGLYPRCVKLISRYSLGRRWPWYDIRWREIIFRHSHLVYVVSINIPGFGAEPQVNKFEHYFLFFPIKHKALNNVIVPDTRYVVKIKNQQNNPQ